MKTFVLKCEFMKVSEQEEIIESIKEKRKKLIL